MRTANEGGFYYEWYELESVLVESDHTPPLVVSLEKMAPNAAADHCDMLNWTATYGKPNHTNHDKTLELLKQNY